MTVILILIILFAGSSPAFAAADYGIYSDTVQAVFDRLGVPEDRADSPDARAKEEPPEEEPPPEEKAPEEEPQGKTIRIKPPNELFEGSILERIQRESTVSLEGATGGVDRVGTSIYNAITRGLVGISPVLLAIGAIAIMFSKGKAVGAILFVMAGLLIIFNAPEIVKIFLNFIAGIFR